MAKKKKTNEKTDIIKSANSLVDQKWLYNPVAYSQISGDFTMLQQRVLAGILEKMQEKILRSINDKKENELFPSLFSEEEMTGDSTEIEISASYFGISAEHYSYLEEALTDLANIRIGFPKAYKDKMNYVIAPLFARLELPTGEKQKRTGKIKVVMLNQNLQDFFSMDKGYTEYLARITRISKKVRTPRIYIFLSSFQDLGHKKVAYDDFCKFLGIDDQTARLDRLNKINQQLKDEKISKAEAEELLKKLAKWENPFHKFNKVRSQILEPAKLELDTFSDKDEIDITFEYEPLYENVSKRGNPSHLLFTIIKKRLAIEHDREQALKRQRHTLVNYLIERYRDINVFDLRELVQLVSDEDFEDFKDWCYNDVNSVVERKQPDFVGEYVSTMIENWIKERRKKHRVKEQKENLFTPEPEGVADTIQLGEGADQWQQLLDSYDGEYKDLIDRAEFMGLINGVFYVGVSLEDNKLWEENFKNMDKFYQSARKLLSISRYQSPVVREVKK